MNDWELLQQYRAEGSEWAFEQLVSRHLGLVYATALRRLNGDTHLAQDVAQLVFGNLARKAHRLRPGVILAGWLHRDTCFTSLTVLRQERRRRARERSAATMHDMDPDSAPDSWEQIGPRLDEALTQLPAKDRDALLLRFFERRSLEQIGQQLGFGESGASRRVTRALEKLRVLLARNGVTTTAAALSAVLMANAAQAAPAGLVNTLSAASLSAAGASNINPGILALMSSFKAKAGVAALILAGVGGSAIFVTHHMKPHQVVAEDAQNLERQRLSEAGRHLIALITFAADHNGQLPTSLDEVGLMDDQFELVAKGMFLPDTNTAPTTVILQERKAWQKPGGPWVRVYGYADGHSQAMPLPAGEVAEENSPK